MQSGEGPLSDEQRLIQEAIDEVFSGQPDESCDPLTELLAKAFVGYTLVRELHRGGQGVIYLAIQHSTKRRVAIKVMHEGPFAGARDKARFEREVEILASLNHPNIVAVHDSGEAAGHFYYVMDYIPGQPLDAYIASEPRSVDALLKLFGTICQAVNAAHMRGVIHRDLKPSNILIDAEGQPHVVDFGLAKVMSADASGDGSPRTVTGQFVGSLPWASPEQAAGMPDQIDTRTDVYSLGVVLYQMLTERFPYEVVGNMRDVLENILKAAPARPSTVRRQINDEVETIVLKCLSKERVRRYQSAGDLAQDVHRYLTGAPIQAKRDSGLYLTKKLITRYRMPVAVGVVILIAGVVLMIWLGLVSSQLRISNEQLTEQTIQAQLEADKAKAVEEFLVKLFTSVDPAWGLGRDVRVVQILDTATQRVGEEFEEQLEVQATLRQAFGRSYFALGVSDKAEPQLRRAIQLQEQVLGEAHQQTLDTKQSLAVLLRNDGRYKEAARLYRQAIDGMLVLHGTDSPKPYRRMMNLARLEELTDPDQADETYQQALQGLERTLEPDHRDVNICKSHYGLFLLQRDQLDEAKPMLQDSLAYFEKKYGVDHAVTAISRYKIARLLAALGENQEATSAYEQAIAGLEKAKGVDHPDTLATRDRYARFLSSIDQKDLALETWQQIVELASEKGLSDRVLGVYQMHLGRALKELNRLDEAEPVLEQAVAALVSGRGVDDEVTIEALRQIVGLYDAMNETQRANPYRAMLKRAGNQNISGDDG